MSSRSAWHTARLRAGRAHGTTARQGRTQARAGSSRARCRRFFSGWSRHGRLSADFGRGFHRRRRSCLGHRGGCSRWRGRRGRHIGLRSAFYFSRRCRTACKYAAQLLGNVFIDGTRVGLLFRNAQLRQLVDQLLRFDLQLPRQYVNANLVHRERNRFLLGRLALLIHT